MPEGPLSIKCSYFVHNFRGFNRRGRVSRPVGGETPPLQEKPTIMHVGADAHIRPRVDAGIDPYEKAVGDVPTGAKNGSEVKFTSLLFYINQCTAAQSKRCLAAW